MDNSSATNIAINVFVAPGEAFAALKEHPKFLLPLLLLMLFAGIATFLYINGVDVAWMVERALSQNPNVTGVQATEIANTIGGIPQAALASVATIGAIIGVLVLLLLQALYFKIFSVIAKDGVSYKLWFGVVSFCALPTLLRYLSTTANLLVNDISMMPSDKTNPLSVSALLGVEPSGRMFENIVLSFDLMTIWSLALLVIAARIVAGKSITAALAIVLTPLALIVGIWFAT